VNSVFIERNKMITAMITALGRVVVGIKLYRIECRLKKVRGEREDAFIAYRACRRGISTHRVMNPYRERSLDEKEYLSRQRVYDRLCIKVCDLEDAKADIERPIKRSSSQLIPTP
jgi:hypothetical protein